MPGNLASPMQASAEERGWRFAQCFGDKGEVDDITEADIISTVEFNGTGNYLATGDKGGRVVLFERNDTKYVPDNNNIDGPPRKTRSCEYKFYTEFQSHEPEFDYLKSLEIEEKINSIRWVNNNSRQMALLSTNDKTIKLWKVYERNVKVVAEGAVGPAHESNGGFTLPGFTPALTTDTSLATFKLPRLSYHETIVAANPKRTYANAHAYHVNSISVNSDGETFLSADDLRVNLWNFEVMNSSFNILDIKPVNMEELSEVITAAEFHPVSCNLFAYSSSKGSVKLTDMRVNALCEGAGRVFEEEEDPTNKSFFSEIISSVSDIKFAHSGRYILSRDYLTLRIWDLAMEKEPVKTINVHEHLRTKLCDLYENDCIFDKFECGWSGDDSHILSGSYNNNFHIYDINGTTDTILQADKSAFKAKKIGNKNKMVGKRKALVDTESVDFAKKIMHTSWHPRENTIAIAACNNLFIYTNPQNSPGQVVDAMM